MNTIDGKLIAEKIKLELRKEIIELTKAKKRLPGLAIILVGDDEASKLYVKLKKQACHQIGIEAHDYIFAKNTPMDTIKEVIDFLNRDPQIDGIMIQLPLPAELNADQAIACIADEKDVDGLKNNLKIASPLILAIYESIVATGESLKDKNLLAIAKNEKFINSLKNFFKEKKLMLDVIHPDDERLNKIIKNFDVLISVVGKPKFIKKTMVKKDAIVIDCGISKLQGKVVGDVDLNDVKNIVSWITPVPGGIGPITVAMLLKNCINLYNTHK